jgi:flagellar assembly protein FliH
VSAPVFAFDQLAPPEPVRTAAGGAPTADDIARAVEAARAEGFHAGHAAGAAEAQELLRPALETLHAAAAALDAERADVADAVERAAVQLGLAIAEQAMGAAIAAEPEAVLEAVRGALRRIVERERIVVLVNPDDLEVVRAGLSAVTDALGGVEHAEVQAERRVARGGAVVRTAEGEVDASVDARLQRAREVLEDELTGRGG